MSSALSIVIRWSNKMKFVLLVVEYTHTRARTHTHTHTHTHIHTQTLTRKDKQTEHTHNISQLYNCTYIMFACRASNQDTSLMRLSLRKSYLHVKFDIILNVQIVITS